MHVHSQKKPRPYSRHLPPQPRALPSRVPQTPPSTHQSIQTDRLTIAHLSSSSSDDLPPIIRRVELASPGSSSSIIRKYLGTGKPSQSCEKPAPLEFSSDSDDVWQKPHRKPGHRSATIVDAGDLSGLGSPLRFAKSKTEETEEELILKYSTGKDAPKPSGDGEPQSLSDSTIDF
jgi:hypothetical protein